MPPAAVGAHYDDLDAFYRDIWGEHVHHGYWVTGRETVPQAVDALAELVAQRLDAAPGMAACDIGCGYGATARLLADRHGLSVTGVTISAAQAAHAAALGGISGGVTIRVQDWLHNDFAPARFDRAYAIESSEHMGDKQRFFDEASRVLRPGGVLVVCAWLARPAPRAWEVRHLLEPICREGRMPGMGDASEYVAFATRAGFAAAGIEDLSARVRRTWAICLRRVAWKLVTDRRYARFLFDRSAPNRVFLLTMLRLLVAYRTGSMRYGLFVFRTPGA